MALEAPYGEIGSRAACSSTVWICGVPYTAAVELMMKLRMPTSAQALSRAQVLVVLLE